MSKASISRLTCTLCELGFLKFDSHQRRYRLGSVTLSIGHPLLGSLSIPAGGGILASAVGETNNAIAQ